MATNEKATREKYSKQWAESLEKQLFDIKYSLGNAKTEDEVIKNILKLEDITQLEKFNSNSDVKAYVLDINENGYILSSDGVHTKTEGIYVAGDNQVKLLRQLTTAVNDGSLAATVAIREMTQKEREKE